MPSPQVQHPQVVLANEAPGKYIPRPPAANLREVDLTTIYKALPEPIKKDVKKLAKESLYHLIHAIEVEINDHRNTRVEHLLQKLERGTWVDVRWGHGFGEEVEGKTFLALCIKTTGKNVKVWMFDGDNNVPVWWVRRVHKYKELAPVTAWDGSMPKIPEKHPALAEHPWKEHFHDGFYEKIAGATEITSAVDNYYEWVRDNRDTLAKIKELKEDQLLAIYHQWYPEWVKGERKRADSLDIDSMKKGAWVQVLWKDGHTYPMVFLGVASEEPPTVRVWDFEGESKAKIPLHWVQKKLPDKPVKLDKETGDPTHDEKMARSPEYKAKYTTEKLQKDMLQNLADHSLSMFNPKHRAYEWSTWLDYEMRKKTFADDPVMKKRTQSLLNWFHHWHDPVVARTAAKNLLMYEHGSPLIVNLVTVYRTADMEDSDPDIRYLRAVINLLEGHVRAKDKTLEAEISHKI